MDFFHCSQEEEEEDIVTDGEDATAGSEPGWEEFLEKLEGREYSVIVRCFRRGCERRNPFPSEKAMVEIFAIALWS